jgi:hypothetical protein
MLEGAAASSIMAPFIRRAPATAFVKYVPNAGTEDSTVLVVGLSVDNARTSIGCS